MAAEATPGIGARLSGFFTSATGVITSLVALIGAVGALYVAVGGGHGAGAQQPGPQPEPPAASMAKWRQSTNAICAALNRELRGRFGRAPATDQEFVVFLGQALPLERRARGDIAALEVPSGEHADIEAYLAALDERDAAIGNTVAAWQRADVEGYVNQKAQMLQLDRDGSQEALNLGLSECGVGPFD